MTDPGKKLFPYVAALCQLRLGDTFGCEPTVGCCARRRGPIFVEMKTSGSFAAVFSSVSYSFCPSYISDPFVTPATIFKRQENKMLATRKYMYKPA